MSYTAKNGKTYTAKEVFHMPKSYRKALGISFDEEEYRKSKGMETSRTYTAEEVYRMPKSYRKALGIEFDDEEYESAIKKAETEQKLFQAAMRTEELLGIGGARYGIIKKPATIDFPSGTTPLLPYKNSDDIVRAMNSAIDNNRAALSAGDYNKAETERETFGKYAAKYKNKIPVLEVKNFEKQVSDINENMKQQRYISEAKNMSVDELDAALENGYFEAAYLGGEIFTEEDSRRVKELQDRKYILDLEEGQGYKTNYDNEYESVVEELSALEKKKKNNELKVSPFMMEISRVYDEKDFGERYGEHWTDTSEVVVSENEVLKISDGFAQALRFGEIHPTGVKNDSAKEVQNAKTKLSTASAMTTEELKKYCNDIGIPITDDDLKKISLIIREAEKNGINFYDDFQSYLVNFVLPRGSQERSAKIATYYDELAKSENNAFKKTVGVVGGTVTSLGAKLAGAPEVLVNAAYDSFTKPEGYRSNPYKNGVYAMGHSVGAGAQRIVDVNAERAFGKTGAYIASSAYSIGTSVVDNVLTTALFGKAAPAVMAAKAGADTAFNAQLQGAKSGDVMKLAVASAAAEYLGEKVDIKMLEKSVKRALMTNDSMFKAMLKTAPLNMTSEFINESATEIMNIASEWLILENASEAAKAIDDAYASGKYDTKVLAGASYIFQRVLEAGIAGAISGGILSGGSIASYYANPDFKAGKPLGNVIKSEGGLDVLLSAAKGSKNKHTAEFAAELSDAVSKGKTASGRAVGALANMVRQDVATGDIVDGDKVAMMLEKIESNTVLKKGENISDNSNEKTTKNALMKKLTENIGELESMKPVYSLNGNEFSKGEKKLSEQVEIFFNSLGNVVKRPNFGSVILDKFGIKSSIAHGMGRAKAMTFSAVPSVIENGKQIDYQADWKDRGYDTYVFAAPVQMNEKTVYVAAVVTKSHSDSRYYLHEVVDSDGNVIKITEGNASFKTVSDADDGLHGETLPSNNSISQKARVVNRKSKGTENAEEYTDEDFEPFFDDYEEFDFGESVQEAETGATAVQSSENADISSDSLGRNGRRQFSRIIEKYGAAKASEMASAFHTFYNGARNGLSFEQVKNASSAVAQNVPELVLRSAFFSGQNDARHEAEARRKQEVREKRDKRKGKNVDNGNNSSYNKRDGGTIYEKDSINYDAGGHYGEKENEGSSSDAVSKRRFSRSSAGGNTKLGKGTRRFSEGARKRDERTQYTIELRKSGKLKTGQVIEDIVCDVVPEEYYSKDMRSVAKTNAGRGIHRTVFVSGELKVEDVPGEVFYADGAYIEDENGIITVIIQCDNYHHTPKQINDHEYIHKEFNTRRVQQAKEAILRCLNSRERAEVFEATARNLKGLSKITTTLIQEELTANVLSRMDYVRFGNQFDELRVAFWNGDDAFVQRFNRRVSVRKYDLNSILFKPSDMPPPLKAGDIFPVGSGAEAGAISTIWANNDGIKYGARKVVSHRGQRYVIVKDADSDVKYSIWEHIPSKDYLYYENRKEEVIEYAENFKRVTRGKTAYNDNSENQSTNIPGRLKYSYDIDVDKHNGKAETTGGLAGNQDGGRSIGDQRDRTDERGLLRNNSDGRISGDTGRNERGITDTDIPKPLERVDIFPVGSGAEKEVKTNGKDNKGYAGEKTSYTSDNKNRRNDRSGGRQSISDIDVDKHNGKAETAGGMAGNQDGGRSIGDQRDRADERGLLRNNSDGRIFGDTGRNERGIKIRRFSSSRSENELYSGDYRLPEISDSDAEELLNYIDGKYSKDSAEYKLAKELTRLEKERRNISGKLKKTVDAFRIKSFAPDSEKVTEFANRIAERLGFEKHIPNVSSVKNSLSDFYKMMESFIAGELSEQEIASAARGIAGDVTRISGYENQREGDGDYQTDCVSLVTMDSVASLSGNELSGDLPLREKIKKLFDSFGNNVHTNRFGNVALTNSSIRSDLRHGSTKEKITAYAAIPEVLKNGVVIDSIRKNNGEIERTVVAAPITIEGMPYFMGVMLQRDANLQRLYLHDVIIKKEASEYQPEHLNTTGPLDNESLSEKEVSDNRTEHLNTTGPDSSENLFMTDVLEKAVSVGYSISQNSNVVNSNENTTYKKQSNSQYLADLQEIRKAYVQDVKESYSNNNITSNDDVVNRHSLQQKKYSESIEKWWSSDRTADVFFELGEPSEPLKQAGITTKTQLDASKVLKILNEHPEMDIEVIKQLYDILENPVIILKSKKSSEEVGDSKVIYGSVAGKNGVPVMVSIRTGLRGSVNSIEEVSKITSAYTRRNTQNFINSSEVLWIDKNKERTDKWMYSFGLRLPSATSTSGSSAYSISQNPSAVNRGENHNRFTENLAAKLISSYLQVGGGKTRFSLPSIETLTEKVFSCEEELSKIRESIPSESVEELRKNGQALKAQLKSIDTELEGQKKKTPYARLMAAQDEVFRELSEREQTAKEKLSDYKAERREREQREKLLRTIRMLKSVKTSPDIRKHIDELVGNYDTLGISLSEKKRLDLSALRVQYEFDEKYDPDFIRDKDFEEELSRLDKRQLDTLPGYELAAVLEDALSLSHQVKNQKYILENGKRILKQVVVNDGVKAIENSAGTVYEKGLRKIAHNYNMYALNANMIFKKIFGYDTENKAYKLTQSIEEGEAKAQMLKYEFEKPFRKLIENREELKRFTGKKAKVYTFDVAGKQIRLTGAMKVSLFLQIKNDDFLRHACHGGITIPDIELLTKGQTKDAYSRGKTIVFTPSEMKEITLSLTEYEAEWARVTEEFFNKVSKQHINDTSLLLYGYEIANVENYFPITTDENYTAEGIRESKRKGTLENKGIFKKRDEKSEIPVRLDDVTSILERHIKDVADFAGLAVPIRNFDKVYKGIASNGTSFREAISKKWGRKANDFIKRLLDDLQNPPENDQNPIVKIVNKTRGARASVVMALNVPVTIGNFAAYFQAGSTLGKNAIFKAMKPDKTLDTSDDIIDKYTPMLALAREGNTIRELGDIRSQNSFSKNENAIIKFASEKLNIMQNMDIAVRRLIWRASEIYIRDNSPSLSVGSDEYYRAVAEIFNRTIRETQPNYSVYQRSELLRSTNVLTKEVTMFKSALMQNYNIVYDAYFEYRAKVRAGNDDEKKKALERLLRVLGAQFAGQIFVVLSNFLTKAIFTEGKAYRDDDDKLTVSSAVKGMGKDFVSGITSTVVYGDEIKTLLLAVADGIVTASGGEFPVDVQWYSSDGDFFSAMYSVTKKGYNVFDTIAKWKCGEVGINSARNAAYKFAVSAGELFGIPIDNVVDTFTMPILNATELLGGNYGRYMKLKLMEDGFKTATLNDMCKIAFDAYAAGDMDIYKKIKSDMINLGYITNSKFVSKMKGLLKQGKLEAEIKAFKAEKKAFKTGKKSPGKVSDELITELYGDLINRAARLRYLRKDKQGADNIIAKINKDSGISKERLIRMVESKAKGLLK